MMKRYFTLLSLSLLSTTSLLHAGKFKVEEILNSKAEDAKAAINKRQEALAKKPQALRENQKYRAAREEQQNALAMLLIAFEGEPIDKGLASQSIEQYKQAQKKIADLKKSPKHEEEKEEMSGSSSTSTSSSSFKEREELDPLSKYLNTAFTIVPGAPIPEGWTFWQPAGASTKPEINHLGEGHLEVKGSAGALSFRANLSPWVGKTLEFSASLKSKKKAYLSVCGMKEIKQDTTPGKEDWQHISVEFPIPKERPTQLFYIGTPENTPFEVKDVRLIDARKATFMRLIAQKRSRGENIYTFEDFIQEKVRELTPRVQYLSSKDLETRIRASVIIYFNRDTTPWIDLGEEGQQWLFDTIKSYLPASSTVSEEKEKKEETKLSGVPTIDLGEGKETEEKPRGSEPVDLLLSESAVSSINRGQLELLALELGDHPTEDDVRQLLIANKIPESALRPDQKAILLKTGLKPTSAASSSTTLRDKGKEKVIAITEDKEDKRGVQTGSHWPKDIKERTDKITRLGEGLDQDYPQDLREHFEHHLKNKDLVSFDVMGGGDCLGYALQLPREKIVEYLLDAKGDEVVRNFFARPVAEMVSLKTDDWTWTMAGKQPPTPSEKDYEEFITNRYQIQRENLDVGVALALGKILGFSAYTWSLDTDQTSLILNQAYYNPHAEAEKHILLEGGHYMNLLTPDASPEEIDVAMSIERKTKELVRKLQSIDDAVNTYGSHFGALKVLPEGPFVHKIRN